MMMMIMMMMMIITIIIIIIIIIIRKAQNQVTTANSHTGHCTRTSESDNVKIQNIFHV